MDISFKKINNCSIMVKWLVREWRNLPEIRRWMWTQHIITEEEHQKWLDNLKTDESQVWFVIYANSKPVGLIGVKGMDLHHRVAREKAFYIVGCKGIAVEVEKMFLDIMFNIYPIDKIGLSYIDGNIIEHVHNKTGFIREGILRNHAILDGKPADVIVMGITRKKWEDMKRSSHEERQELIKADTEMSNEFWAKYFDEVGEIRANDEMGKFIEKKLEEE